MLRTIILSIFLLPLTVFSQSNIQLSGTISNAEVDAVEILIDKYYIGNTTDRKYAVIKEGRFEHDLKLELPSMVKLVIRDLKMDLYLAPGDELNISIDAKQGASSAKFDGKGAVNNEFLNSFNTKFGKDFNEIIMKPKLIVTSTDELEMLLFDNRKSQYSFLKSYPKNKALTDNFKAFIKNRIEFNYWRFLFESPIEKAEVNKSSRLAQLPKVMTKDFNEKLLESPNAMIIESFRLFLPIYMKYQASAANDFNKFNDLTAETDKIYDVAVERLSGLPLTYLLASQLWKNCSHIQPEAIRKLYSKITELDEEGTYVSLCKQRCGNRINAKRVRKQSNVKSAVDSKAKDSKSTGSGNEFVMMGEDGKEFSLSDLRNNVVYIDFWASWCGPCRQQFPFAKKLKEKLTKKQLKEVKFLYISIDKDEKTWKNAITKYKLDGVHGFSPGGWGSQACKYFKINSIPRYMLMDKKGNIVNTNAPRPSQDQTLNDILNLL